MTRSLPCLLVAAAALVGCAPPDDPLFAPVPGSPIAVAGGPGNVALGDVNGDGKPDVVASNLESDTVTVLLAR